jgi:hypothetical protein
MLPFKIPMLPAFKPIHHVTCRQSLLSLRTRKEQDGPARCGCHLPGQKNIFTPAELLHLKGLQR